MLMSDGSRISVSMEKDTTWLTLAIPHNAVKGRITLAELEALIAELSREATNWRRRIIENPYQVLGVPQDASDETIKQAYRQQMHLHHPDKGGSAEKAKAVN